MEREIVFHLKLWTILLKIKKKETLLKKLFFKLSVKLSSLNNSCDYDSL